MLSLRSHWGLVLGLLLALTLLGAPVTGSADQAGFSEFAGAWYFHGSVLQVLADGTADYTYRTYNNDCGDPSQGPCDVFTGDTIMSGGSLTLLLTTTSPVAATGTVAQSNDARTPVGTPVVLTLGANDTLDFQLGDQDLGQLCGPSTPSSMCGA